MKLYQGYIFDMDGVMYRGDEPIQDAVEAANILKARGCKLTFVTNNSAKLASEYKSILLRIGIDDIDEEDIITSGDVTAEYLENQLKKYPKRSNVLCVAEESVKHLLREIGMEVIDPEDYRKAHYVVVGFYKPFDWKIGTCAADAIATYGAKLIGTNPDPARPVESGEIEAGTGSIISFVETASRTKALLMGKPYPGMYKTALRRMHLGVSDVLMVGDMLVTDVKGALDIGMDAALVLTGMTRRDDIEKLGITPTFVIDSLRELILCA
jgi:4-nitrophenyl phosphatase